MLRIDRVLGSRLESAFSEEIHRLEHRGAVDVVNIPVADLARHQLMNVRTIPDFTPSEESYAPAVRAFARMASARKRAPRVSASIASPITAVSGSSMQ